MTMRLSRIQTLVDRLLVRDERYRPLALLRLVGRLPEDELRRWEQGDSGFLQDGMAGNIDAIVGLLRQADGWARKLGLAAEIEPAEQRCFRNPQHDRLARTVWRRRVDESAQGDLFFDNRFSVARSGLARSLVEADAAAAEQHLADLARAVPGNEHQADAEHLVGSLAWLGQAPADTGAVMRALETDIALRARRFLGHAEGERFLARFWQHLQSRLDPTAFDPEHPDHHPSAIAERLEDWPAVIACAEAVPDYFEHAALLACLASAALQLGQRDRGLQALCQLCWRHPAQAEQWLDASIDEELNRRIAIYWDMDETLPIGLFPAWLALTGYAVPDCPPELAPQSSAVEALAQLKTLRQDPTDIQRREWLQLEQPALFELWMRNAG